MEKEGLAIKRLQSKMFRGFLQNILLKGKKGGGPLLFLWIVGAGFALMILNSVTFALLITAVCAGAGFMIFFNSYRNDAMQRELLAEILKERFSLHEGIQKEFLEETSRSLTSFTEIALKILKIIRAQGKNEHLVRVLADADQMLALQLESAEQVNEFERILRLVRSTTANGKEKRAASRQDEGERLRDTNIRAIEAAITDAKKTVDEISAKLETLMLQVVQMERKASDLVRTAQFAEETTGVLHRLQAVVDARRETANDFLRRVSPRIA